MKNPEIRRFEPLEIAKQLMDLAESCLCQQGSFKVVLAGGKTPAQLYKILEEKQPDTTKWKIFVGDERNVPLHHAERNSTMIEQTMPTLLKKAHYYPLLTAQEYDKLIAHQLPFDVVLVGMGEDGHLAGIFPNITYSYLNYLQTTDKAPKPPPRRISLRIETLNASRHIWVLVTGEAKKNALTQWLKREKLPITQLDALEKLILFCDDAALPN